MDITIDPLSASPIYQQIRDRIVEQIATGRLSRGDSLHSVRTLATAFGINPATVAKAYDALRAEGLVAANAKSGTFVAADRDRLIIDADETAEWRARLVTLLAEGRAKGITTDDLLRACTEAVATFEPAASAGQRRSS